MKAIKFLSTLFVVAIASTCFAQQPVLPNYSLQYLLHHKKSASHSKTLTRGGATYVPVNEVDSSYDAPNNVWVYEDNVTYQYYISNCMDSVATTFAKGTPEYRTLYFPYVNGYSTGYTSQSWNGKSWVNSYQEIVSPEASCASSYVFIAQWTAGKWDTIDGYKETVKVNNYGNPVQISDSSYVLGEWVINDNSYFIYDSNDTLRGINTYQYSKAATIDTMEIDTNFKWIGSMYNPCSLFSSNTNNVPLSYFESFIYDSSLATYLKSFEIYYYSNPSKSYEVDWQWNGVGYDTASTEFSSDDSHNNLVSTIDKAYDSTTQHLAIDYHDSIAYTYDANSDITREEEWDFYCSPNDDSLYPCEISIFYNFVSCISLENGIESVNANDNMLVYPNPATDNFTIVLPSQVIDARVEIFNSIGQRVKNVNSFNDSRLNINTSDLSKGMYYVRVISGTTTNTAKIVIE